MRMAMGENSDKFVIMFRRNEFPLALGLLQQIQASDQPSIDLLVKYAMQLNDCIQQDRNAVPKLEHKKVKLTVIKGGKDDEDRGGTD